MKKLICKLKGCQVTELRRQDGTIALYCPRCHRLIDATPMQPAQFPNDFEDIQNQERFKR